MSTCSPRYRDENGIKNTKRMEGQTQCDYNCVHWKACWEELREGSKRVLPLMSDKQLRGFKARKKYERA